MTGMMEVIVNVMAEVLIILGLATKEIKQGKISELVPNHTPPLMIYCSLERFLRKLMGKSDIKDALQRLNNLVEEESRMGIAQGLKDGQEVGDKLDVVIEGTHLVFMGSSIPSHIVLRLGGERLRGELQQAANDQKRTFS
jgi:hypothetical protein